MQLLALQEYPAASLLDNGAVIPPSCAKIAGKKAEMIQMGRIVDCCSAASMSQTIRTEVLKYFGEECGQAPQGGYKERQRQGGCWWMTD